jgi:hypothetical protein
MADGVATRRGRIACACSNSAARVKASGTAAAHSSLGYTYRAQAA